MSAIRMRIPSEIPSTTEVERRIDRLAEDMKEMLDALKPNQRTAFLFGGAHRLWIMESARLTAEKLEAEMKASSGSDGEMEILPSAFYRIKIPTPPKWNGTRPEGSNGFKDLRHFENTLRYWLGTKQIMMKHTLLSPDHSDITIQLQGVPLTIIIGGWAPLGDENLEEHLTDILEPPTPRRGYEPYCDICETIFGHKYEAEAEDPN